MALPILPVTDGLIARLDPTSLGYADNQRVTEAPAVPGSTYGWYAQNGGPIFRRRKDGIGYLYQTASSGTGLRWSQPAYTNLGSVANGAWVEGYGPIISGEDQVYKGKIWRRSTHVPSTNPITRLRVPGSSLNGQTATASVEVANDTASPVYITFDFSDNTTGYTLQPGEVRRLTQTGPNNYSDYHFSDIETPSPGSILWREWQVEVGSTANPYTPDSFSPTTDQTVFVVARPRSVPSGRIVSGLSNNSLYGWHANTEDDFYGEGWVRDSATAATTNLKNYAFRRSGTTSSIWSSGILLTSNGNAAQLTNGLSTNGHLGASEFSESEVYEVLVYERALSDGEIAQVSQYLNEKYFSSQWINESDGPLVGAVLSPTFSGGPTPGRLHVRSAADSLTPSYVDEVLASDPIDYRRFGEVSGNVLDSSRRNHAPATASGTFRRTISGPFGSGTAGYFGGNASINLGTEPDLQITGSQTVEMWLRPENFSGRLNPWNKQYWAEGAITQETNGYLNYYYGIAFDNYIGFTSGAPVVLGQWNHVVVVRDLENMRLKWFINGVKNAETAAAYPASVSSLSPLLIGTGYSTAYSGGIDEVATYARALSDDEILRHYRKGAPADPPQNRAPDFSEWELAGGAYVEADTGDLILPTNGAVAYSPMMEVGTASNWWWSADYQSFSGGSINFPGAGGIYEQADYYDANGVATNNTGGWSANGNAPTWPHGTAFSRETWSFHAGNSVRHVRMSVHSTADFAPNTPIRVRNPQFTTDGNLAFTYSPPTRAVLPPPVRTGKALIVGEVTGAFFDKLKNQLGYTDITTNTSASTLADLVGYDLIISEGGYVAFPNHSLIQQAYDAGYSVLTNGNDSNTTHLPMATAFAGQGGFGLAPAGSPHYVAQGWEAGAFEGDSGNIITGLRSTAVPIATHPRSDGNGTGYTGFLEENPNGSGGRWVHLHPYASIWDDPRAKRLLQRAVDWLVSPRPASGEDTLARTAILVRTASDSAPAEDNKDYIVRGDSEVNLDGVAGYYGAGITRVTGDVYLGTYAAEITWNGAFSGYSQGLIWFTNANPEGVPANTTVISRAAFKGVAGKTYVIAARPTLPDGNYLVEGNGGVAFIATGAWQIVETSPYTVAQAFRPALQITSTAADGASAFPFRVDEVTSRSATIRSVVYKRKVRENDLMRERSTYEWSPGGTIIRTALPDPTGDTRAFSVDFTVGQVYAIPYGGTYNTSDGFEVGGDYEVSVEVQAIPKGLSDGWSLTGGVVDGYYTDLTRVGTLTSRTGPGGAVNGALQFDGNGSTAGPHLRADPTMPSRSPSVPTSGSYTLDAWINPDIHGEHGIIGYGTYGSNGNVNALRLTASGIHNYWWANDLTVATSSLAGAWHHVCATYDHATSTHIIYLDGVEVGRRTATWAGAGSAGASNLTVGRTHVSDPTFDGGIAHVGVFSRALTPAEVQARYNTPGYAEPINFNWSMEGQASYDVPNGYQQVQVAKDWTTLTRRFIYSGGNFYPLFYSIGGIAAGRVIKVHRPAFVRLASDSTSRFTSQLRTSADTSPSDDAASEYAILYRSAADSTPVSDAITDDYSLLYRAVGDGASAVDDGTRWPITYARSGADSVAGTDDTTTRSGNFSRTADDTTPADDGEATRSTSQQRSSETVGSVEDDVATSVVTLLRTGEDGPGETTDAASSASLLLRATGDAAWADDSADRVSTHPRSATEEISTDDSADQNSSQYRTPTDTAELIDEATRLGEFTRNLDEAVPESADEINRVVVQPRTTGDDAPASDSITEVRYLFRTGDEDAPETDEAERFVDRSRSAEDVVSASDAVERLLSLPRTPADTAEADGEAQRTFTGTREVAEEIPEATDTLLAPVLAPRTAEDTIPGPTDEVVRAGEFTREPSDSAPATDDGTRWPITFARSGAETLPEPTDALDRAGSTFLRDPQDELPEPGEDPHAARWYPRWADDALEVGDSAEGDALLFRVVDESLTVGIEDFAQRYSSQPRTVVEDPTYAGDEVVFLRTSVRGITDPAPAQDAVWSRALLFRALDLVLPGTLDAAIRLGVFGRAADETIPVAIDVPGRVVALFRRTGDDWADYDDWAYVRIGTDYRVTPRISILSISRTKIGPNEGFENATIQFFFDLPVTAWTVRVNSTSHVDGTEAASWEEHPPTQYGVAVIPASALLRGDNTVTVYGRSLDGIWTV